MQVKVEKNFVHVFGGMRSHRATHYGSIVSGILIGVPPIPDRRPAGFPLQTSPANMILRLFANPETAGRRRYPGIGEDAESGQTNCM